MKKYLKNQLALSCCAKPFFKNLKVYVLLGLEPEMLNDSYSF